MVNPATEVRGEVLPLVDRAPRVDTLREEVLRGLSARPKTLPCKLFYDERGSLLFDEICEQDEYYPTRTELALLREHGGEMAECIGEGAVLLEYGSGTSIKTRLLLDALRQVAMYVPVDIAREHLQLAAAQLAARYPSLTVQPICADYTTELEVPRKRGHDGRVIAYFPGSTIGNFTPREAGAFLRRVARATGPRGGLLIGVDLKKDPALLDAAYNDKRGVTAAFNLNVLARLNRELGSDFDPKGFSHRAFYDPAHGRVEMQLVSQLAQSARVAGARFAFDPGEAITTEYSYKYSLAEFRALARDGGFETARVWTDKQALFSVQYLRVSAG